MLLAVGYWWLGQWAFGALPLLPFHYLPHSTREGFLLFSSMAHRRHLILGHPAVPQKLLLVPLSIPLGAAAVKLVHPKWCQSGTLPLDSLPLDEHAADWQALKWSAIGCQTYDQFHFEVHQLSCLHCFPQCQFSDLIEH